MVFTATCRGYYLLSVPMQELLICGKLHNGQLFPSTLSRRRVQERHGVHGHLQRLPPAEPAHARAARSWKTS